MKVLAFYLIFNLIILLNSSVKNEQIDLFNFDTPQDFKVTDEEIRNQLKKFETKLHQNKFDAKKLKGIQLQDLTGVLDKYIKLTKQKEEKPEPINKIETTDINFDKLRFKSSTSPSTSTLETDELTSEEMRNHLNNTRIQIFPYNIAIRRPDLILKDNKKNVFVDNRLLQKIVTLPKSRAINVATRSIPIEECNKNWDYALHGEDWNCMCQCGNSQSPVDILSQSARSKTYSKYKKQRLENKFTIVKNVDNIFFDFKDPEFLCNGDENESTCPNPLIVNTGKSIVIETECGILVMPPHMNGYECYKLELHTPSEHKIDSVYFEIELQIFFKLTDKRIIDQSTRDIIIVSVFVKGIDENNIPKNVNGFIRNHPFLELLEIEKLPKKKGQARILTKLLNFNYLFDKSKQPYVVNNSLLYPNKKKQFLESETEIFLETSVKSQVQMAINDLVFDKFHPLDEFYIYEGSSTKPPCEENVMYIVIPNPIYAPMSQIIGISKVIINSGNKIGNNRNIQKLQGRFIQYYKDPKKLQKMIDELSLNTQDTKIRNPLDQDDEDLDDGDTSDDDFIDNKEEILVDKIINTKTSLNKILSLANLK